MCLKAFLIKYQGPISKKSYAKNVYILSEALPRRLSKNSIKRGPLKKHSIFHSIRVFNVDFLWRFASMV